MWKYVLGWVSMVFIAIANGAIREGWYGKHMSELQAHQISTATGVLLLRPSQLCLQLVPCLVFSGTSRCGAVENVALPKSLAKLIAEVADVISQSQQRVCFRF